MSSQEDLTWDLSSILADVDSFDAEVASLWATVRRLTPLADALDSPDADDWDAAAWDRVLPVLATLSDTVSEVVSWAGCSAAAHTDSDSARRADSRGDALYGGSARAWSTPISLIARCSDAAFAALLARPALADLQPALSRARERRPVLLPPAEQQLFDELADDALNSWGQRYQTLSGRLRIDLDGQPLSPGQAKNRLESRDAPLRTRAQDAMDTAWSSVADDCAEALTHIIGIRSTVNDRLGVDELTLPLVNQRIQRQTLTALMDACRQAAPLVGRYLAARARLVGTDKLDWQDLSAPVGQARLDMPYDQARALVADKVRAFSPDLGDFVQHALDHRWVEAEDRPGKRPGAFCARFPRSSESRIFLTFGGGPSSVRTLAHELGHGYHNWVMADLPWAHRSLTSCLAESASTFAEAVVRDALLDAAPDDDVRLALLDRELSDATTFLANIPMRFELERRIYALRKDGPLQPQQLSDATEQLQRAWYGPLLGRSFPLFWAEKLHFYLTSSPFYNFPYAFGYLFSGMIYARAKAEGPAWAQGYRDLLRATGQHSGEVVAQRFLGVDLTASASWSDSINSRLLPLIDELENLVAARS